VRRMTTWYAFTCGPLKARFHDWRACHPSDVVFTFNILMNEGAPFYKAYYGGCERG